MPLAGSGAEPRSTPFCACVAIVCYIGSLLAWPDTKGQDMVPDLELLPAGPGGTA